MSAALQERMSLAAFLEWERGQELRYEFDGAGAVAMNGGTLIHGLLLSRMVRALEDRLAGRPSCVVFPSGVKVAVSGRIRYPDAIVTCSPFAPDIDIVPEPVVVVEILSTSTAGIDRIQKNAEYAATPSIQHYVMLEQSRRAATIFTRAGADWVGHIVLGDGVLHLPAIGVEMTLGEVYGGLSLPEADD